jgi:hypothetical protein
LSIIRLTAVRRCNWPGVKITIGVIAARLIVLNACHLEGNRPVDLRAAQYLRMSTEEQDYSTLNQEEAIAAYSVAHNIEVVRTYSDDSRSGLQLCDRPGLRSLLNDVQTDQANFDVILVYDVSRWGRFQDVDESAYYEYICKKSGIPVIYCAEDFENGGSLVSTLIKTLQRAEAADYKHEGVDNRVFPTSQRRHPA